MGNLHKHHTASNLQQPVDRCSRSVILKHATCNHEQGLLLGSSLQQTAAQYLLTVQIQVQGAVDGYETRKAWRH